MTSTQRRFYAPPLRASRPVKPPWHHPMTTESRIQILQHCELYGQTASNVRMRRTTLSRRLALPPLQVPTCPLLGRGVRMAYPSPLLCMDVPWHLHPCLIYTERFEVITPSPGLAACPMRLLSPRHFTRGCNFTIGSLQPRTSPVCLMVANQWNMVSHDTQVQ